MMHVDEILLFVLAGLGKQGQVWLSMEGFRVEMVTDHSFLFSRTGLGPVYLIELD